LPNVGITAVAKRLPASLRAYRGLTAAAMPLTPLLLRHRVSRGREDLARMGERRGESDVPRPQGSLVWMHGASVGEMLAIIPLAERIRARGFNVLVTSGTVTSAELAERRLPPGAIHQFVPLDVPRYVTRFLDHWRPGLALIAESDLWPNIIVQSAARGIPLVLVNGRVSQRSYERWRRVPGTIAAMLERFDLCLAQSVSDADRYSQLGAPRVSMTGNLKLDVPAPPADAGRLEEMQEAVNRRPIIVAASTHPGEEAGVIEAHRQLRQRFRGLLTIVVPRHPQRGEGVLDIANVAGLQAEMRSRGYLPGDDTDIYIADTIGELGVMYRLTPIVFMGGSLVRHGGQNPIEAAKLGAAILHGPHVWNFADIYAALDDAHGAEEVADPNGLVMRLGAWLHDPDLQDMIADAALKTVEMLGGALDRTVAAIEPYLMQLRLEHRSG
jgi:3-deoxy-D-manno-octulosonic-acid transferase